MDSGFSEVYKSYVLIVERVPDAPSNAYRRVGIIRFNALVFAWTGTNTMTII